MKSATLKFGTGWPLLALLGLGLGLSPVRAQTTPPVVEPSAAASAPLAVASPAPASSPAAPLLLLDGIWKGPLTVPGGQLDVIFRLVKLSSGDYFATLDVPQQKVSRLAVRVEIRHDTVRFVAEEAASRFTGRLAPDGRQLSGIWQQPGYQAPITLRFAPAPVPTAPSARLTPPYREEEVLFSNLSTDLRLGGQLTVPPGAGPFPAVVLLSDTGPHDRNGTTAGFSLLGQLADYLTRRGIAVLRVDDRGVGTSTGEATATTEERVADAQAALNFLRTRSEIDLAHLGLIGHGEGGNVALLAAAQPLPPAFVVTLGAVGLSGIELVMQQRAARLRAAGTTGAALDAALRQEQNMLEIIRLTPDNAQAQAIVANMLRQRNPSLDNAAALGIASEMTAARDHLLFNPALKLTGVTCPVLLLHGTDDISVDADANLARLSKGLSLNKKVEEKKLVGVNHLFLANRAQWNVVSGQPQPTFSPQAQEIIRAWILGRVKKG